MVWSLAITTPAPGVPPPPRAILVVAPKPIDVQPAEALVTERSCAVPVCSVIAPVLALIVGACPVIAPILPRRSPTVSSTRTWVASCTPVAAVVKVIVVPSTTMVSPTPKPVGSESLGVVPDSFVALVIATGGVCRFIPGEPAVELSVGAGAGVPTTSGLKFVVKSEGFNPPAAVMVPAVAVELDSVVGTAGRLAAYCSVLVSCAGMKLFWNWSTCGTLPSGLPVLGSTGTPIR